MLVVAVVLVLPAAAAARAPSLLPKLHASGKVLKLQRRGTTSCSAHVRSAARVAKIAKKVLPVACEQPPRSWVRLSLQSSAASSLLNLGG
jgi:hypothetical protein